MKPVYYSQVFLPLPEDDCWEQLPKPKKTRPEFVAVGAMAVLMLLGVAAHKEMGKGEEIELPVRTSCREGFVYFDMTNRCYKMYDGMSGTWSQASDKCRRENTEIISTHNIARDRNTLIVSPWNSADKWKEFIVPRDNGDLRVRDLKMKNASIVVKRFFCAHGRLANLNEAEKADAEDAERRIFLAAYGLRKADSPLDLTTAHHSVKPKSTTTASTTEIKLPVEGSIELEIEDEATTARVVVDWKKDLREAVDRTVDLWWRIGEKMQDQTTTTPLGDGKQITSVTSSSSTSTTTEAATTTGDTVKKMADAAVDIWRERQQEKEVEDARRRIAGKKGGRKLAQKVVGSWKRD